MKLASQVIFKIIPTFSFLNLKSSFNKSLTLIMPLISLYYILPNALVKMSALCSLISGIWCTSIKSFSNTLSYEVIMSICIRISTMEHRNPSERYSRFIVDLYNYLHTCLSNFFPKNYLKQDSLFSCLYCRHKLCFTRR